MNSNAKVAERGRKPLMSFQIPLQTTGKLSQSLSKSRRAANQPERRGLSHWGGRKKMSKAAVRLRNGGLQQGSKSGAIHKGDPHPPANQQSPSHVNNLCKAARSQPSNSTPSISHRQGLDPLIISPLGWPTGRPPPLAYKQRGQASIAT